MWNRFVVFSVYIASGAACAVSSPAQRASARSFAQLPAEVRVDDGVDPFAGADVLEVDALIEAVLARSPSIEAARQAWRGALARYDSATSFQDTTVGVTVAPLSLFSSDVKIGFGAQISQAIPYPGKRRLRGEVVVAEAEAARANHAVVRQRLALMAARLYYDYFLLYRALEINAEHLELLEEYVRTVELRLQAGRAWQDDALKVDVDIVELKKQRASLEADRAVVVAQLNALLHRGSKAALPPPPTELAEPGAVRGDRAGLADEAIGLRPELKGVDQRTRGARAAADLADREYYPDLRLIGTYNRMWPMLEHQIMVGISVNLPTQRSSRRAAVEVAEAAVARTTAERAELIDGIRRDIDLALARIAEADEALGLYRDRALPAARDRVAAIRLGLDAGRTSFIEVIRAEREQRSVQLKVYASVADAYRWRAELDWAVGRAPAATAPKEASR